MLPPRAQREKMRSGQVPSEEASGMPYYQGQLGDKDK